MGLNQRCRIGGSKLDVEKIVISIEEALNKECYLPALALTLVIPDICANLTYPEIYKKNEFYNEYTGQGAAYAKWFDEYIAKYEINPISGIGSLDGRSCWKLRCGFLHSWEIDVDNVLSDENNDITFKFTVNKSNNRGSSVSYGKNGNKSFKHISEDLVTFCIKICSVFKHSYLDDKIIKEKLDQLPFNFIEIYYK